MNYRRSGFTLVEVMVTLAIATILLAVAAPSLTSLYESSRADSEIRRIHQALQLARNHAISYGTRVTVCPTTGGACGTDWIGGFRVFTDGSTADNFDGDDIVIKEISGFNNKDFISFSGSAISFSPDGLLPTNSTAETISYCPAAKDNSNSKSATISTSGRISFDDTAVNCT
ncbi:GspH/FimT family pseudopilin [Shewanella gelidimarina]|uniref:GspH/FimT family pseudopilin n=1 Tax=Shewanella gelidimarina TaxID=56813 RepID=UPI00200FD297|nr:GspH/FimT family pseudopilin [Shewanella gelidimarina]MCL1056985.1 GspH/FimT family pseudopilin [Shewanella gelidimarina]